MQKNQKNKRITCLLLAFLVVVIVEILTKLLGMDPRVFSGSLVSIFLFIFIFYIYYRNWGRGKKNLPYFLFLILFLYAEFIGFYVAGDGVRNRHDFSYTYCLLSLLVCVILVLPLAQYLSNLTDYLVEKNRDVGTKNWIGVKAFGKYFLIFMFCWLPIYAAFFPGVYCYDIPLQWRQYIEHSYGTWNPIVHSLLWGILCDAGNFLTGGGSNYNGGVALYSLFQLSVVAASLAYACTCIGKMHISRRGQVCTILFFALFPLFPLMGISTTKDTIFSALFVVVIMKMINLCTGRIVQKAENKKKSEVRKLVLEMIFWMALMSLFRNNSIYGMLLSTVVIGGIGFGIFIKNKYNNIFIKISLVLLVAVFVSSILGSAVIKISHADVDNKGEKLSLPGQQLARVYIYQYDNLTVEEKKEIEFYYSKNALKEYIPDIADPVKNGWNYAAYRTDYKGYYRLWIKMGMKYPREYIAALLLNTQGLWHVGDLTHTGIRDSWLELKFWKSLDESHIVSERSLLPGLKKLITYVNNNRTYQIVPVFSVVFGPALYNWLILFAVAIAVKKKRIATVIPGVFILCYSATLLLGPCILMRYCLPFIMAAPFYCLFVLSECRGEETLERNR